MNYSYMPSFISHAIIGYLLFGQSGAIYGILPDVVGFLPYFAKIGLDQGMITLKELKKWGDIFPQSKMSPNDWLLYNLSHSLIVWLTIYYITKDKAVYSAIFAIILDIFMHTKEVWKGPAFLYPLSQYRYDGIHWLSYKGMMITFTIIALLFILPKETKQKFIDFLP